MMQNLIKQPQYFTILRINRQTVVADVATVMPVANLTKPLQCKVSRVIQFRGIVKHQDITPVFVNLFYDFVTMGRQYGFVCNILAIAQSVKGSQVCWRLKFVRECSTRMTADGVGTVHQSFRSPFISELRVSKMHLTKSLIRINLKIHPRGLRENKGRIPVRHCHIVSRFNPWCFVSPKALKNLQTKTLDSLRQSPQLNAKPCDYDRDRTNRVKTTKTKRRPMDTRGTKFHAQEWGKT